MKYKLFLVLIVIIIAGVALLYTNLPDEQTGTEIMPQTDTEIVQGTEMPSNETPIPDLDYAIVVTTNLSEESKENALKSINDLVVILKEEPDSYPDWMELGTQRKLIGDIEGAKDVWLYAAAIRPNEATPLNNLANLYIYEFQDFEKGEEYLLAAIAKAPKQNLFYYNAYEFYRFALKDEAKAKAILQDAIVENPLTALEFQAILDSF